MSRPWMPLYVSDYLGDTLDLTAAEHGAYLLLLMHYWQHGGLPSDEVRLARIARLTPEEWSQSRDLIAAFFEEGWRHKRVELELSKAAAASAAGRAGGLASGEARRARTSAEQTATPTDDERPLNGHGNGIATMCEAPQPLPHLQPEKILINGGSAEGGRKPPRHGATSTKHGRVYVMKGTSEWEAYAADYKKKHFADPIPNETGGKWFKTLGEAAE